MRDIKFRAWDKNTKEMVEVHQVDTEYEEVGIWQDDTGSRILHLSFDDIELMQYTGLKDKNSKEIYEGDIVFLNGKNWIVQYDKTEAKFVVFNGINSIRDFSCLNRDLVGDGGVYVHIMDTQIFEPVVIGNIYESEDLMKGGEYNA